MKAIERMIESGQKVIVRTEAAGVFYGVITEYDNTTSTAEVTGCRRIWYWSGAASLSEMALSGVKRPADCKFSVTVSSIVVMGVKEILPCSEDAVKSIESVPVWKA